MKFPSRTIGCDFLFVRMCFGKGNHVYRGDVYGGPGVFVSGCDWKSPSVGRFIIVTSTEEVGRLWVLRVLQ